MRMVDGYFPLPDKPGLGWPRLNTLHLTILMRFSISGTLSDKIANTLSRGGVRGEFGDGARTLGGVQGEFGDGARTLPRGGDGWRRGQAPNGWRQGDG